MPDPRPRRQTDQDPTIRHRGDLMTLGRLEMNQGRSAELMLVLTSSDEQPTVQHHNQRMLMNLMISKPLSLRKSQQDHTIRILVRAKNPGRVSLNTFGVQLPKLHVEAIICDVHPQTRRGCTFYRFISRTDCSFTA